jgi:hypothetical protein
MLEVEPNHVSSCRGESCRAGECRVELYPAESYRAVKCRVPVLPDDLEQGLEQRLSCCQWEAH